MTKKVGPVSKIRRPGNRIYLSDCKGSTGTENLSRQFASGVSFANPRNSRFETALLLCRGPSFCSFPIQSHRDRVGYRANQGPGERFCSLGGEARPPSLVRPENPNALQRRIFFVECAGFVVALWSSSPQGICFYFTLLQLFSSFSAQKSHIKSQNHLNPTNQRK